MAIQNLCKHITYHKTLVKFLCGWGVMLGVKTFYAHFCICILTTYLMGIFSSLSKQNKKILMVISDNTEQRNKSNTVGNEYQG